MIKAVIFDFDGTLANTGRFLYEVCERLSEKYCPNKLSAEEFLQFKYMSIPDRFKKARVPHVKLPRIAAEARAIYA